MEKLTRTQKIESLQVCRNWLAEDHPGLDRTIPSLEWAIKELQSPWIKIEDGCEMPESHYSVLAFGSLYEDVPPEWWKARFKGDFVASNGMRLHNVTAWMPLPEPPTEE